MRPKALAILFIAISVLLEIPCWAQSPASTDAALLEQGKQVFASKCAKCHDVDATKKLPDGTTLLTRLAAAKDSKSLLATRLKSMSEQDGRAVAHYVESLLAQFRAGQRSQEPDR